MTNKSWEHWFKIERRFKHIIKSVTTILAIVLILVVLVKLRNHLVYRDIEMLKVEAPIYLEKNGFVIEAYTGYVGEMIYGGTVFYICHRKAQSSIIYNIKVVEWKGEIQMTVPKVINKNIVIN